MLFQPKYRVLGCLLAACLLGSNATAAEVADLRLVPFPKEVRLQEGRFRLDRELSLHGPADSIEPLAKTLGKELERVGMKPPRTVPTETGLWQLVAGGVPKAIAPSPVTKKPKTATNDEYHLSITPDAIQCRSSKTTGLFYGIHTLVQLIRANRTNGAIPCLTIRDWPSMRYRCFQDDMTRGPSSTLKTLQQEVALGAELKLNLFTYYMEYQYAFKKHPLIGPANGSLEPDDLKRLVDFAALRHVDILGNQQSFGHLTRILQHEQYAPLRETRYLLCPVKEGSYQLLDDLYSEVCPLLPFEMFNVCCDETWGLGKGPSKTLAEKIGTGGVYVQHIRRVHDLLKEKHQKRMMMWGDIILQHPDHLDQIPKDTVMLTWGYAARPSFEDQILPFAKSGYEFFVCPGVSNWSRILPDFGVATTNIQNFVRDGVKHGALGMLNTAWEDDGEALNGPKWHGYAWSAECAWNASTTTLEDFNRRIGPVLFGSSGDHFGSAIELLAKTHRMPGMSGMNNRRFWQNDFRPLRNESTIRRAAEQLLKPVQKAIEHLEACKAEATVNAELLDYFLFGARRMELIGLRMLDGLKAAKLYTEACDLPLDEALPLIDQAVALVQKNRDAHAKLGREFQQLWLAESKPYALDWTLKRYATLDASYAKLADTLVKARKMAESGKPLPTPESVGLALSKKLARRTRPHQQINLPLLPKTPWEVDTATHRLGLVVRSGKVDRFNTPIEVDLTISHEIATKPVCAIDQTNGKRHPIVAQLDPSDKPDRARLTLIIPDRLAAGSEATVHVYLGLTSEPEPHSSAVSTVDVDHDMKRIENDQVRLLLAPEGGHVYRWEVKAASDRDLTMPGENNWAGFSDVRFTRNAKHAIECLAQGPALVRYRLTEPSGRAKTLSLFAGASWIEVVLNEPVDYYWDFDNPSNFAADSPTPGEYLFSNGKTGLVGLQAEGISAQVKASNVRWAVKFRTDRLALGMITPERAANFVIGPGDTAGGVGIEKSPPVAHFVTFAGVSKLSPSETFKQLRQTLDLTNQPEVIVHAIEAAK